MFQHKLLSDLEPLFQLPSPTLFLHCFCFIYILVFSCRSFAFNFASLSFRLRCTSEVSEFVCLCLSSFSFKYEFGSHSCVDMTWEGEAGNYDCLSSFLSHSWWWCLVAMTVALNDFVCHQSVKKTRKEKKESQEEKKKWMMILVMHNMISFQKSFVLFSVCLPACCLVLMSFDSVVVVFLTLDLFLYCIVLFWMKKTRQKRRLVRTRFLHQKFEWKVRGDSCFHGSIALCPSWEGRCITRPSFSLQFFSFLLWCISLTQTQEYNTLFETHSQTIPYSSFSHL